MRKHFAWGAVVQRLVWALVISVSEHEPRADTATCLGNRTIRFDEHFFVLQAAPQAFNEDVVEEPALAVHATAHTTTFRLIEKRSTGELYALIGVEHLRLAKALHRLLQSFHAIINERTAASPVGRRFYFGGRRPICCTGAGLESLLRDVT